MSTAYDWNNNTWLDEWIPDNYHSKPGQFKKEFLGPQYWSLVADALFLGIILCQLAKYNLFGSHDNVWLKGLVWYVAIICLFATGWLWYWMWEALVVNFGRYYTLVLSKYFVVFYATTTTVVFGIQSHYIHKLYKLWNNNRWLAGLCLTLAFGAAVGAFGIMGCFASTRVMLDEERYENIVYNFAWLFVACSLAADFAISSLIVIALMRSRTGWDSSDRMLIKLAFMTFECQLIPTLFTASIALLWAITAKIDIAAPYVILGCKIYANTFLYSLNSRAGIRKTFEGVRISKESEFSSAGFTGTTSGMYSTRKPSIAGVPELKYHVEHSSAIPPDSNSAAKVDAQRRRESWLWEEPPVQNSPPREEAKEQKNSREDLMA